MLSIAAGLPLPFGKMEPAIGLPCVLRCRASFAANWAVTGTAARLFLLFGSVLSRASRIGQSQSLHLGNSPNRVRAVQFCQCREMRQWQMIVLAASGVRSNMSRTSSRRVRVRLFSLSRLRQGRFPRRVSAFVIALLDCQPQYSAQNGFAVRHRTITESGSRCRASRTLCTSRVRTSRVHSPSQNGLIGVHKKVSR